MLKKGPEIKLPDLKVPDFLVDLYWDLRERHLLPLAILLVVALVAVPIALSDSASSVDPTAVAEEASISASGSAGGPSGTFVSKFAPGLREYKRRLGHLHARDPFKSPEPPPDSTPATTVENEASPSSTGAPAELVPTGESEPAPESTSPAESEPTPTPGPGNLTYYSYALDVRVTTGDSQAGEGSADEGEPSIRHNLPELTMLPSRKTPAVIYMGSSKDGRKALMLVSSDVKAIFGDGKCVLGSQTCELLALEPGTPETFVYGNAGKTFKIEILKIDLVETDKLNRAPLGREKGAQGQNRRQAAAVASNSQVQPR